MNRLEDAAKQLVTLTTTLQGLYLALFALSDLRKQLAALATTDAKAWLSAVLWQYHRITQSPDSHSCPAAAG